MLWWNLQSFVFLDSTCNNKPSWVTLWPWHWTWVKNFRICTIRLSVFAHVWKFTGRSENHSGRFNQETNWLKNDTRFAQLEKVTWNCNLWKFNEVSENHQFWIRGDVRWCNLKRVSQIFQSTKALLSLRVEFLTQILENYLKITNFALVQAS